jgi:hypothetical protein
MAKNSIRDYDATSGNNTDVQSVDISEGCAASGINNAIREVMADLKDVSTGTVNLETPAADRLDVDNIRIDGNTISSTDTNGDINLIPNGTGEVVFHSVADSDNYVQVSSANNSEAGIRFRGDSSLGTGTDIGYEGNGNHFFISTVSSGTATERMLIKSGGDWSVSATGNFNSLQNSNSTTARNMYYTGQYLVIASYQDVPLILNRMGNDGSLIHLRGQGTVEGTIAVSGTTVSYNGGHLSRWSQLTDGTKDDAIVKGTVMTNLDQMAVWSHGAVKAQDAVVDDDGNVITEAVEAKDAYTEDNEQLNCMAVSSVEGDANVAGVFVNWDYDDDGFNDMNVAMTGDMVIRIASGTTVARGDLLMSAGDGTAKPQGDDIVRSKTIAKVTSTNVSHTYDDGSYLVPCVLMAC